MRLACEVRTVPQQPAATVVDTARPAGTGASRIIGRRTVTTERAQAIAAAAVATTEARRTAAAGLRGFEWAVGVPGTVGGAVRMNAGGHGADIARSLKSAEVLDLGEGTLRHRSTSELEFGYRRANVRWP